MLTRKFVFIAALAGFLFGTVSIRAQDAFQSFGLVELLGADHIFHSVEEATGCSGRSGPARS